MSKFLLPLILAAVAIYSQVNAQTSFDPNAGGTDIRPPDVIQWHIVGGSTLPDGRVQVAVNLTTKGGFTLYTTKVKFEGPSGFRLTDQVTPKVQRIVDPIGGAEVEVFEAGSFELTFLGSEKFTAGTFPLSINYVGCTDKICLFPYTETLEIPVYASADKAAQTTGSAPAPTAAPTHEAAAAVHLSAADPVDCTGQEVATITAAPVDGAQSDDFESGWAKRIQSGELGVAWTLLLILLAGVATNLTPCVYPMIPITIRLLAKRPGHSPLFNSTLYAAGIILTYTVLGVAATASGAMFGSMLANPTFNIVFAIVMALLGLTMLGFGDLSKLQMLGSKLGAGKPTPFNTFLMGTGAGLVASPCTGPVLAALLALTAKSGDLVYGSLLLFVYSLGFGLPYIALGSFAAKASTVKVPPTIQVGIKLLFAAIMFGLALYYLRIPLYPYMASLRALWQTLTWIFLPTGLFLAAIWVISTRLQNDKLTMIIPTTILGLGIFSASQALTSSPISSTTHWFKDEGAAYAHASKCGLPMIIDMWAEWCEACKKMDKTTFQDARVQQALRGWTPMKFDLTEENDVNTAIQEKYEIQSLPTLVLVPKTGEISKKEQILGYVTASELLERLAKFNQAN
jgi:thiol:disulfide interchange protein DsbD